MPWKFIHTLQVIPGTYTMIIRRSVLWKWETQSGLINAAVNCLCLIITMECKPWRAAEHFASSLLQYLNFEGTVDYHWSYMLLENELYSIFVGSHGLIVVKNKLKHCHRLNNFVLTTKIEALPCILLQDWFWHLTHPYALKPYNWVGWGWQTSSWKLSGCFLSQNEGYNKRFSH